MQVRSSIMRIFSFDRYNFHMKFPTGFTYRNVHGFARLPGDRTALVVIIIIIIINETQFHVVCSDHDVCHMLQYVTVMC